MDAAPLLLSLQGVGLRFGRREALRGIDIAFAASAVVAILGGNGAGKTTLLRVIAGALQPTAGQLRWSPGRRPRVALVAQAVALYPFLTVLENCLAAGRMEGSRGPALHRRAEAAIERTLTTTVRDRLVGQLSGGTQRRAAIAAALMGDAPLVVLDEPTTGLDAEAREAIVAICRTLRLAGKTVVLATHDFALADAVADQAVFLRDGAVAAAGAPAALCRERFGDAREVELLPAAEPGEAERALLLSLGAEALGAGGYALFSQPDARGVPVALATLRDHGLALREVRIAVPGTAALFREHCGADAARAQRAAAGGGAADAPRAAMAEAVRP